jgi:hypothetical protein
MVQADATRIVHFEQGGIDLIMADLAFAQGACFDMFEGMIDGGKLSLDRLALAAGRLNFHLGRRRALQPAGDILTSFKQTPLDALKKIDFHGNASLSRYCDRNLEHTFVLYHFPD